MTCIIGVEHEGKVWMGGDSAASANGIVTPIVGGKVFLRGEFVMGNSGPCRLHDLLRYVLELPNLAVGEDVDAYMRAKFAPALRECVKAAGLLGSDEEKAECFTGSILVGVRGLLYEMDGYFSVSRSAAGYNAVGSGCEVALGSLSETEEIEELLTDPEQRIRRALLRAEQWTEGVRGPFTVLST